MLPRAELRRRDAEGLAESPGERLGRAVAGVEGDLGDGPLPEFQHHGRPLQPQPPDVGAEALPHQRLEHAMEMIGGQVRLPRQPVQLQLLVQVLLDEQLHAEDAVPVGQDRWVQHGPNLPDLADPRLIVLAVFRRIPARRSSSSSPAPGSTRRTASARLSLSARER